MRKRYRYAAAATTLTVALACSDSSSPIAPSRLSPNNPPARSAGVTGAVFTTTNPIVDGGGHCKNGNELVNCNIYDGKQWVWLTGGPGTSGLPAGDYFFAVMAPGGQGANRNPNDGTPKNLSDVNLVNSTGAGDPWTNRVFHVDALGVITYGGTHDFDADNGKIRLMGYDDTPNPGGVYILAICAVPGTASATNPPGVDPSICKYDAFKAKIGETPPVNGAEALAIDKDAAGAYDNTFAWTILKSVDKTLVEQIGGNATFNYTVVVTRNAGTISSVVVSGTINVYNLNVDGNGNTVPVAITGVTDALSDGTVCDVTGGGAQSLTTVESVFAYSCTLSELPENPLDNKATVAWDGQDLSNTTHLDGGSADFTVPGIIFTETKIDDQITVKDTFNGVETTLGTVPPFDAASTTTKTFKYAHTVSVPAHDCSILYNNSAVFTTNTTGATDHSDQSVQVCGPHATGALTIGFWKGPNGNSLIQNFCAPAYKTSLASYLSGLGAGAGPFAAAAGKSCSQLVTYVNGVIGGASATNMNNMLKAQMLATALDVYFSSTGYTTVTSSGKNAPKPPSNFLPNGGIGTFKMDLTHICPMVDNTTTGSANCSAGKPSTNGFASGAFPWGSQFVSTILNFAATAGVSPWATGAFTSPTWYGSDRTKQEILKNVFDQINNQLAFTGP